MFMGESSSWLHKKRIAFCYIIGVKSLARQFKNSVLIGAKKLFSCRNASPGMVFYDGVRMS